MGGSARSKPRTYRQVVALDGRHFDSSGDTLARPATNVERVTMHLLDITPGRRRDVDREHHAAPSTGRLAAASERFGRTRSCVTTPSVNASGALTTQVPGGASPSATSTGSHVGTGRGGVQAAGAGLRLSLSQSPLRRGPACRSTARSPRDRRRAGKRRRRTARS
jgi:hypothetical protein